MAGIKYSTHDVILDVIDYTITVPEVAILAKQVFYDKMLIENLKREDADKRREHEIPSKKIVYKWRSQSQPAKANEARDSADVTHAHFSHIAASRITQRN